MTFYVSCYNQDTLTFEPFQVPEAVYIYVKQLENKIKYPNDSELHQHYPWLKEMYKNG